MPRIDNSILVVDDNITNLKLMQEILKSKYKVFAAPSGEQALAFLEKNIPALILLDVEMPVLNGYEVIKRLKQDTRFQNIPVIFLTAQEGQDKEELAFKLGAVDYIVKPISSGVVLARVALHLELESYRKNLESIVNIKTIQLQNTQDAILEILAHVTAYRDNETGSHITRTTLYTNLIANHLLKLQHPSYLISETFANHITKSSKLHDIGKVAISDTILLKPAKLTDQEFEFIKEHTTFGSNMIEQAIKDLGDTSSFLHVTKELVLFHHEWWNGMGYPMKLSGFDIPLSARIMSISDVYDALTTVRPYKKPFTHEETMEIMLKETGTHFDPILMELCKDIFDDFQTINKQYSDQN